MSHHVTNPAFFVYNTYMSILNKLKRVHLIGAGGIGVSAVGKLLLQKGIKVSGSDVVDSDTLRELEQAGATVLVGSDPALVADVDLVIYSSAVPEDDSERVAASKVLSYFEFLGELSQEYKTIVVSGTHGKSTTTAMLGLVLEAADFDPTVIVGTKVPGWELGNLRVGQSEYLVVEGCEHMAHMLELHPEIVVLTNVEAEHLDYYRDLDHVRETFQKFVNQVPKNGFVVRNADDSESMKLKVAVEDILYSLKDKLEDLKLQVPGEFNISNALAALTTATKLGVDQKVSVQTLSKSPGVWRRFERVGEFKGAQIISDYAHHPTAIRKTLEAAREYFSDQRLVVCFQPHQHARTRELFDDFVEAFELADELIVSEIYDVVGRRDKNEGVSSKDLVEAMKDQKAVYVSDLTEAEQMLRERVRSNDIVIIMGAGDIDQIARNLCK